jgi:hypothetical protein
MIDRSQVNNRSQVDLSAVIPWINDAGAEIPAYGVIQLRTNYDTTSHALKPDGTTGLFFVNGPVPVASTKRGESLVWNRPRTVLLDGSSVGREVGPVEASWQMTSEGTGFRVLKQAVAGVGVVVQVGGGGTGGGGHRIWFDITSVTCNEDLTKTLTVNVTHFTGGCDEPIPGEDEYGNIIVEDICGILNYYTEIWLESGGIKGSATYVYPRSGYCEPKWIVDNVCGQPECA